MPDPSDQYIGRFAPSPSGPLHLGSLVTALASFLDARCRQGQWLLRIEDVDQVRTQAGATDAILHALERLGFAWDGPVLFQSRREALYRDVLDHLIGQQLAYPCGCTRAEIAAVARAGRDGPVYPGTCREGLSLGRKARAWRVRTSEEAIGFQDRIFGQRSQALQREIGDFVLRRADGFTSYQLAVVIDDQEQGVTQVVRGADLLGSTPRQIYLQRLLDYATPGYAHLPLVLDAQGRKLSKSDQAPPLDLRHPARTLATAWHFLFPQQPLEPVADLNEFWAQALAVWNLDAITTTEADAAAPDTL